MEGGVPKHLDVKRQLLMKTLRPRIPLNRETQILQFKFKLKKNSIKMWEGGLETPL